MMTRNTEKRVEILVPIFEKTIKSQILDIVDIINNDNVKARKIAPNGELKKIFKAQDAPDVDSQAYFLDQAQSFLNKEPLQRKNLIYQIKNKIIDMFKK